MDQIYQSFARIWANGHPVRSEPELVAAVRAAGMDADHVSDEWLKALNRSWVYYEAEDPFDDDEENRAYRRELRQLLL